MEMFLCWEYSNRHLKIEDEDPAHCCAFARDGTCAYEHQTVLCDRFSSLFTFFRTKVHGVLAQVLYAHFNEDSHAKGLQSCLIVYPS